MGKYRTRKFEIPIFNARLLIRPFKYLYHSLCLSTREGEREREERAAQTRKVRAIYFF